MHKEIVFRSYLTNWMLVMQEIMTFWLTKGVDGFRLDVAPHLVEDANFTNEQPLAGTPGDSWFSLNHTYTKHQPLTFELLSYWSEVIYNWTQEEQSEKYAIYRSSINWLKHVSL